MSYKLKKEQLAYIIILILFFIFPTSINRITYSAGIVLLMSVIQSGIIMFFAWQGKINNRQFLIAALTVGYLLIATFIALSEPKLSFSIARFAPIICFVAMCCIVNQSLMPPKFFICLLDIMCIVIIIWNLLTMLNIRIFIEFVNCFYTQLDSFTATYWSLESKKPVFTFGVHNFASIFYMHFFLFSYYVYKKLKKKRCFFYMLMLLIYTLLLRSSSSLGIAAVMCLFLYNLFRKDKKKNLLFFCCVCFGIVLFIYSGLSSRYVDAVSSKANGFIARYSSETTLYNGNYQILKKFPLGIGFTIGEKELNIYFGDSGYIIYYTMGGLILNGLLFLLLYRYYKRNLNRKIAIVLTFVVLLTELSLISFMYGKTIYLYLFEVGFYRSILLNEVNEKRG